MTFIDEFVDELLMNDHSCDIILPRLTKRYILEDQGLIEPRISPLEDLLESEEEIAEEEEEAQVPDLIQEIQKDVIMETEVKVDEPTKEKSKKKWSSKKVKGLFKKEKPKEEKVEGEDEDEHRSGFKDGSLTWHETNIMRANLGLAPLKHDATITNPKQLPPRN